MRKLLAILVAAGALAACDPVMGAGSGNAPPADRFLHVDSASRTAVLTLIAGYPSGSTAFNYNGYSAGGLELTVPVGWTLQVQCENRSTVPNSCAVVSDRRATAPVETTWSTQNPVRGIPAGGTESFAFNPPAPADYRIASLVPGSEASGMWMVVHVVASGEPRITGTAAPNSCATC